jgi:hypothetical protein
MTEAEWLAETSVGKLCLSPCTKGSERKHRLFAVACAHLFRGRSDDPKCLRVLEAAEKFADGLISEAELSAARANISTKTNGQMRRLALYAAQRNGYAGLYSVPGAVGASGKPELLLILRDVFGNPFRSVELSSDLRNWNDGTVPRIAQGIYDERAFDRLPILHDALLDAGCDDDDLIQHCRSEGPHVRGCWVVDLLLGKS